MKSQNVLVNVLLDEHKTIAGVCGKKEDTAGLQDLLVYNLKGLSVVAEEAEKQGKLDDSIGAFVCQALFATITNANFDNDRFVALIKETIAKRDGLKLAIGFSSDADVVNWNGSEADYAAKAAEVGVLSQENEDVRSLRELVIYGLKGLAAYTDHAAVLGFQKSEIYTFMVSALANTTRDLSVDEMVAQVLKTGETAVTAMALLDEPIRQLTVTLRLPKLTSAFAATQAS